MLPSLKVRTAPTEALAIEVTPPRWLSFTVLLAAGLLFFELAFFVFKDGGKPLQIATFIGLPVAYSAIAAVLRKSRRFVAYWPSFFSSAVVSIAFVLMWIFDELPARWLGLAPKAPPAMAVGKACDALLLLLTVIVLNRLFGISLASVFLQRGRLRLGLIIGFVGFSAMAAFAVFEARDMGISMSRLMGWAPWLLMFVLANGFFEELMFRGLFLNKFSPLVGSHLANLLTALVFTIGHAGVTYTADILIFMALTFVFALLWGYLMQKSNALWGSSLFHAGADIVIMIGVFAGVKI